MSSSKAGILVVGDAMVDQHFTVDSHRGFDEKLTASSSLRGLGGTGANAAVALRALGLPATLATTVGDDALGSELLALLTSRGVDTSWINRVHGATGQAVIVRDHGSRQVIVDRGVVDTPIDTLPSYSLTYLTTPHALACVDTLPGRFIVGVEHQMLAPHLYPLLKRADLVITNQSGWDHLTSVDAAPPGIVVETRGSEGAVVHRDGSERHVPATPVTPVDATGAGDAFAAGLVAAYSAGHDVIAATERGVALAAHAVTQAGASLVEIPDELAAFIRTPPTPRDHHEPRPLR